MTKYFKQEGNKGGGDGSSHLGIPPLDLHEKVRSSCASKCSPISQPVRLAQLDYDRTEMAKKVSELWPAKTIVSRSQVSGDLSVRTS